jgi:hypothetical protein
VILAKNYHSGTYSDPWYSVSLHVRDTGKLRAGLVLNGTYYASEYNSTAALPLNQWTHVAMTYDGLTVSLYINGDLDSSFGGGPGGNGAPIEWGEQGEWWVGGRGPAPGSADRPDGWVGRASVDTTAYTPERIRALYENGLAETVPFLVWRFEEFQAPFVSTGAVDPVSLDVALGAPTPLQSSPVGTPAIDFDGSSAIRSEPTALGEPPNITASAWVFVRNPVGTGFRILSKGYYTGTLASPYYSVGLGENSGGFYSSLAIAGLHKGRWVDPLPRNEWSHLAVPSDGFIQRTYVNGKL